MKKKTIYAVLVVSLLLIISACSKRNDENVIGKIDKESSKSGALKMGALG